MRRRAVASWVKLGEASWAPGWATSWARSKGTASWACLLVAVVAQSWETSCSRAESTVVELRAHAWIKTLLHQNCRLVPMRSRWSMLTVLIREVELQEQEDIVLRAQTA